MSYKVFGLPIDKRGPDHHFILPVFRRVFMNTMIRLQAVWRALLLMMAALCVCLMSLMTVGGITTHFPMAWSLFSIIGFYRRFVSEFSWIRQWIRSSAVMTTSRSLHLTPPSPAITWLWPPPLVFWKRIIRGSLLPACLLLNRKL